jgi:alpha-amylase/alpha-mannosidase (GH57 family)
VDHTDWEKQEGKIEMKAPSKYFSLLLLLVLLVSLLAGCLSEGEQQTDAIPDPDVLYVNLTWHQHQPLYYKDADGVYTRPWVRVHATKDYLDMAEKVADYEDLRVTFNYTPSLIRQLNDLAGGAKDRYWVLSEKPPNTLTEAEKRFILERFFDVNWTNIIARYPRYQALLDQRGGTEEESLQAALESFSDQDFFDLQVWFNLAWFDPVYLAEEPLAGLVAKDGGFDERDKAIVFAEVLEVVQKVLPYHKDLQDAGQIEITITPYAHPILPLIYDNHLALIGNPGAEMPELRFAYPQDAEAHLALSVDMYEATFDRAVRGLWPGEGAVAQEIVPMVAEAGYAYMQTGEPVLAKSLGLESFTRDAQGLVREADDLYRPYYVNDGLGNQVAVFFRDWMLSDNIGFVYSGMPGEAGARDLVDRLEAIQADFVEKGTQGPHIVSIILDGENAWEHYPNDGNDFLNALYRMLTESETLRTVTPSEYLEMFPEQRALDQLFPGAWFSPNYDTWIGETEEAIGWDYLARTREFLVPFETGETPADPGALAQAFDFMYLAEGSDWFWWFGDDQDSGQDSYFDEAYRALLAGVYTSLGVAVPQFIEVPVIQAQAVPATRPFMGVSTPVMDGQDDPAWETAAYYAFEGSSPVTGFHYTLDEEQIYLRLDLEGSIDEVKVGFYFDVPGAEGGTSAFARGSGKMVGTFANRLVEWWGGVVTNLYGVVDGDWQTLKAGAGRAVIGDNLVEFSLPLGMLGEVSAGDPIRVALIVEPAGEVLPAGGPAQVVIPDTGEISVVLQVEDPVGDDYGPGTYTYPEDAVFKESVYDATYFEVGYDDENLVLTLGLLGQIENPWGSPIGLSVQTLDVYIDKDPGAGTGLRMLLPGRNAALMADYGWEYAIWVEGWNSQVLQTKPDVTVPAPHPDATDAMRVVVDAGQNALVIRVPLSTLGDGHPGDWAYAAVVLGQEGYPSEGVWRVRDVEPNAAQWRFGGAPSARNHTRIIDLILPEYAEFDQASLLSDFPLSQGPIDTLNPEDFAQIPMLAP